MPQDAFTLRHIARELDDALAGGKVNKIIQPSRDEVALLLYAGGRTRQLVLNTHASFARACLSSKRRTAPDAAPNFCMLLRKHLSGATLLHVSQQGFERILAFAFDCAGEFTRAERVLYAEIMGKYSNLILTENGTILGALKVSSLQESYKRALFPGVRYLPPAPQDKADPTDPAQTAARLASFRGGDAAEFFFANLAGLAMPTCRLLAQETGADGAGPFSDPAALAAKIRDFVLSDECAPAIERVNGKAVDFHVRGAGERVETVNEAADACYAERETERDVADKKRRLESIVQARRKKEEKKLSILCERERACAEMERDRLFGELITSNIYAIARGADCAEVTDYTDPNGRTVRIPLDKTLTAAQNAQKYYKKYNKQKRTLAALAPQKAETLAELDYAQSMLAALARAETLADLSEAEEELRAEGLLPPLPKKKVAAAAPYRLFRVGAFTVAAGRNNVQNDRLLRESAPDDVWLHTQKYHSAHVVIRTNGKKPTDEALLAAAEICAWFSDAQAGSKVPVDYCARKFVKKPSKAKAGAVVYTDYKTVLVSPARHAELEQ